MTLILGGCLLIALLYFIAKISYTIIKNLIDGRKPKQLLEQHFNRLRLSRMLTALGINKTDYLYQTSVTTVQQQMKQCAECDNTSTCDDQLATENGLSIKNIDFCNNESGIKQVSEKHTADNN